MTRDKPGKKALSLLRRYDKALLNFSASTFNDDDYVKNERRYIQARSEILRALIKKEATP